MPFLELAVAVLAVVLIVVAAAVLIAVAAAVLIVVLAVILIVVLIAVLAVIHIVVVISCHSMVPPKRNVFCYRSSMAHSKNIIHEKIFNRRERLQHESVRGNSTEIPLHLFYR